MVYFPLIWMGMALLVAAAGVVFALEGPAPASHDTAEFPRGPIYWHSGPGRFRDGQG